MGTRNAEGSASAQLPPQTAKRLYSVRHAVRLEGFENTFTRMQGDHNGTAASDCQSGAASVQYVGESTIPTARGTLHTRAYRQQISSGEHEAEFYPRTIEYIAILSSAPSEYVGHSDVPCRVHDACWTSEVLGEFYFDCYNEILHFLEQLEYSLDYIETHSPGLVIYTSQEGRGIGLSNKIAVYGAQERLGLDTVDANRALGFPDDIREYHAVEQILHDLEIKSILLLTNNPTKLEKLNALPGITVSGRVPIVIRPNEHNASYLRTKAIRMNHLLPTDEIHDGNRVSSSDVQDAKNSTGKGQSPS